MRRLPELTLAGLTLICCFAHAEPVPNSVSCDSKTQPGDRLDVSCPLPASAEPKRFRFTANFAGGHDDTMAQLVAGLDDQHLTCEPGSKVSLMAEDGEVSLFC